MTSESPKVANSGMVFQNTNSSNERVAGGNRPGINSSGAMITKKPAGGFSSVAGNYMQQSQISGSIVGAKAAGSIVNNNYRSPSPTFQGAGAYSFSKA